MGLTVASGTDGAYGSVNRDRQRLHKPGTAGSRRASPGSCSRSPPTTGSQPAGAPPGQELLLSTAWGSLHNPCTGVGVTYPAHGPDQHDTLLGVWPRQVFSGDPLGDGGDEAGEQWCIHQARTIAARQAPMSTPVRPSVGVRTAIAESAILVDRKPAPRLEIMRWSAIYARWTGLQSCKPRRRAGPEGGERAEQG